MVTDPLAYSRYFYKEREEEVIISVCNYCFAVVAESDDDAELERCESRHACAEMVRAFAA